LAKCKIKRDIVLYPQRDIDVYLQRDMELH